MDSFTTLIGRYNSTLLTLSDGQRSTIALDQKSRALINHGTSSIQLGNGNEVTPKFLSMLEEDAASAGGEIGVGIMAVRQDTLSSLVGADGDYSMLSVNENGALYVVTQSAHKEDDAHTSGDFGQMALFVRNDTAGSLVDTDGDYASGQLDSEGWLRVVPKGMKAEDSAHTSADLGMPLLVVRNDTEGSLVDTDGDYSMLQVDSLGRLRTTAEVDLTPGTEGDVCADEADANDGDVGSVGTSAWVDVVDITLTSGKYLCTAIDGSADRLCQFRLVKWDSSQDPGDEVVALHRKFLVTENNGTFQLVFPRPIEIDGAANISVRLQAKRLRGGGTDATVHGGVNGYTL